MAITRNGDRHGDASNFNSERGDDEVGGAWHEEPDRSAPTLPNALPAIFERLDVQDLNAAAHAMAGEGSVSPFEGDAAYDAFFERLFRALHRHEPRHVLIACERGVGSEAVLLELARRVNDGRPAFLTDHRVVSVDCRRLPLEEVRAVLLGLFGPSAAVTSNERLILCIDGFASLSRPHGPMDNRAQLLMALSAARGRVIGVVSPHELEERFASDATCADLFSTIALHEPDEESALRLVKQAADVMAEEYALTITDDAVSRAVSLTGSCMLHHRLPQKAISVLRRACDDVTMDAASGRRESLAVDEPDIVHQVADLTGVPESTLAGIGERVDYEAVLSESVVGQPDAVREVAAELGLIKAGLADSHKPASVMLFLGQTGTGKTELAKAIAKLYSPSKRLQTYTLGNFSEPHSVSGLIGVPAGYVGHEQGGRLVNDLNANPYSVFLLDEADKAHPDVMQPFLNLFDEGWLLDQRGAKAHAERAIFILTTNVGQRQIGDLCRAGKGMDEITATMKDALSRIRHTKSNRPVFTPEFLARVKRVIVFRSLDAEAMRGICRKLTAALVRQWAERRQKTLTIDEGLIDAVAVKAHALNEASQGKEGGRVVRKLIADWIESPIQSAILRSVDDYRRSATVCVAYRPDSPDARLDPAVVHVTFA